MPGQRIKGQETEVLFVVNDAPEGGLTDIQSFEMEVQLETLQEGYLGEKTDRYDDIMKGVTFSVGLHSSSDAVLAFIEKVQDRATRRTPGAKFNIKTTLNFPNGDRTRVILTDCAFDGAGINFGGRDEYGSTTLSGKCSTWRRI